MSDDDIQLTKVKQTMIGTTLSLYANSVAVNTIKKDGCLILFVFTLFFNSRRCLDADAI